MPNSLPVGLGEIIISRNPEDILTAFGLGSCLGIGMYDPQAGVAGLLHAVLPECANGDPFSARYVDSGIAALWKQMAQVGAEKQRLIVRMAGGANMLFAPGTSKFDIGTRNIAAALTVLANLNLRITAKDVGGTTGRTVRLYVADGHMTVRTEGNQERLI